jgi:hypothetical protein
MELKETPERMVENGRVVEYGAFRSTFRQVNFSDARITTAGRPMPRFYSRLRLKEWQHVGVIGDDFYFGFAIVDAKYLGNSFCYFLDRTSDKTVHHDSVAPPGVAVVARGLWHDQCRFHFGGYRISIDNRLANGFHRARVNIKGKADKPGIRAEIEVIEDLEKVEPLELISLLRGNRPGYTHKVACPVRGEITVGDRTYTVGEERGIALIDVTKTFFPYKTFWNWATCGGHDDEGRMVALNLSKGISMNEDEYNDNVMWVDGRLSSLGVARFTMNENAVLDPWRVETEEGRCVLGFEPRGERWGRINALVIMSDFHQPYGTFRGTAVDSAGAVHEIKDYFGVVEHHVARF